MGFFLLLPLLPSSRPTPKARTMATTRWGLVSLLLPQLLQGLQDSAQLPILRAQIGPTLEAFVDEWLQEVPHPHDPTPLADLGGTPPPPVLSSCFFNNINNLYLYH
jgi:hypothetical protein